MTTVRRIDSPDVEGERFLPIVDLPPIRDLRFRRLRAPADYVPLNDIANASRETDGDDFTTTAEQMRTFYENLEDSDATRDVLVAEIGGRIVGYGRASYTRELEGDGVYGTLCHVDPNWRRRGIGWAIERALEARLREIAAEHLATGAAATLRHFQSEANERAVGRLALLEKVGYLRIRYSFLMIRPTLDDQTDCPLPDGLEIRDVRPEQMRAIWEADVQAFRDHWGSREPTEAGYRKFLEDPVQNDTTLWRVAWDGDQVAGMVRNYVNVAENERYGRRRGWVENISVRGPWRQRGLARALIAASLPLLRARGMTEGALTVDAENPTGALRTYESVGFQERERYAVWRKPL